MKTDRLRFLFDKYVSNTISEEERKEFFQLVSNADADEALKKMLDDLWNSLPDENVHVSIPDHIYSGLVDSMHQKQQSNKFRWLKVAAAFAVLALASTALFVYRSMPSVRSNSISENAIPTKHNSFIRLPDGSTVVLNTGSTLNYPKSFYGRKTREVYLEGEGFFDIKHDPAQPFIVHTGKVMTQVLGTAFNIKAFPDEKEVVVTVTRGKVQVSNDQKLLGIVTRDQQIIISKANVSNGVHRVSTEEAIAWMERDIFFDDVTMEEAMAELENRFNIEIDLLNEKIRKCRFTATFVKGEDLEQILLVICEFNNVTFAQKEMTIEIDGAGCE